MTAGFFSRPVGEGHVVSQLERQEQDGSESSGVRVATRRMPPPTSRPQFEKVSPQVAWTHSISQLPESAEEYPAAAQALKAARKVQSLEEFDDMLATIREIPQHFQEKPLMALGCRIVWLPEDEQSAAAKAFASAVEKDFPDVCHSVEVSLLADKVANHEEFFSMLEMISGLRENLRAEPLLMLGYRIHRMDDDSSEASRAVADAFRPHACELLDSQHPTETQKDALRGLVSAAAPRGDKYWSAWFRFRDNVRLTVAPKAVLNGESIDAVVKRYGVRRVDLKGSVTEARVSLAREVKSLEEFDDMLGTIREIPQHFQEKPLLALGCRIIWLPEAEQSAAAKAFTSAAANDFPDVCHSVEVSLRAANLDEFLSMLKEDATEVGDRSHTISSVPEGLRAELLLTIGYCILRIPEGNTETAANDFFSCADRLDRTYFTERQALALNALLAAAASRGNYSRVPDQFYDRAGRAAINAVLNGESTIADAARRYDIHPVDLDRLVREDTGGGFIETPQSAAWPATDGFNPPTTRQ